MSNPFDCGYYTEVDLVAFGFKSVGNNVLVDKSCSIFGISNIEIGDNVRIDGYCTLNAIGGYLKIGSYIHIGAYCFVGAGAGVLLGDFSGLSQGVKIYSKTDDYSGLSLTNPTVPECFTSVFCGEVILGRHVIVGSGSVILPGVSIGDGASIGALALVTKSLDGWGVFAGIPAKKIKMRSQELLVKEKQLLGK